MPNVWRFRVLDKDNKPVETAPGMKFIEARGPGTPNDMKAAARLLLDNKRRDAIRAGYEDPGYHMDEGSLEPVAEDNGALPGDWRPSKAQPLQLPTEVAPEDADARV